MRRKRQRGFVLVATSLAAVFLIAAAGLAIDIGRMYVSQSEAQSFVDSASLGAAVQLDDSSAGITRALSAVSANPKLWQFGNSPFTNVTTQFSNAAAGPWLSRDALPSPPAGYRFARVTATVNPRLYLLGVVAPSNGSTVGAMAVAGRVNRSYFTEGIFPFSPYSHKIAANCATCDDPADLFGMKVGKQYTFRWAASPSLSKGNVCSGDASQDMIDISNESSSSDRGYIQLNSAAALTQAILGGVATNLAVSGSANVPTNLTLTDDVTMTGGAKNSVINQAVAQRVQQDSDVASSTYSQYQSARTGNGRRMVIVPVNLGADDFDIAGFAGFFLLTPSSYDVTGNQPACAEYVGAWTQGNPFSGGATIHNANEPNFMVRLVQ